MVESGRRQGVRERPHAHQHDAPSPLSLFGPWKLAALLSAGRRLVGGRGVFRDTDLPKRNQSDADSGVLQWQPGPAQSPDETHLSSCPAHRREASMICFQFPALHYELTAKITRHTRRPGTGEAESISSRGKELLGNRASAGNPFKTTTLPWRNRRCCIYKTRTRDCVNGHSETKEELER